MRLQDGIGASTKGEADEQRQFGGLSHCGTWKSVLPRTVNAVANFSMALNRRYRQGDDVKTETTFIDLVAFGRTAEVAVKYLGKGRPVGIEGRLRQRQWETEGGAKRSKIEVVVNQLHLMASQRQERQRCRSCR